MSHCILRLSILFSFLILFIFPENSLAGRVVKVQGKKVFIKLDSSETESLKQGDRLFLTTPAGKKQGLVIIRKKQNDKVIAQLGKGKAGKGMLTASYKSKSPRKTQPEATESASDVATTEGGSDEGKPNLLFGLMGSFGTATQNVANVADMSGSTMGFKGLIDYSLFDSLGVRARIGMDMLSVTGSSGTTNFETSINYLALDLLLRYNLFEMGSLGIFLNGGMGIYSPMSSELGAVQAIREDSISTTSLLIFGGGLSYSLSGTMQLFVGADYLYFPPSEDVSTSVINANLGLIFAF